MDPTEEQKTALDLFAAEVGVAIEAGAGTGKTTTMRMLGASTKRRGQYVAFNRAIVEDAKGSMPSNVDASTMHSLAYKAKGARYRGRLNSGRMSSSKLAQLLDVDPIAVRYNNAPKILQPATLASNVMRAIGIFCQSDDPEPSAKHVPYIKGIDDPDPDAEGRRCYENNNIVAEELERYLTTAWADLQRLDGRLSFTHDHYLKMWQLGQPRIAADFILFDEAQDAAPVMESIVFQQKHAQLIVVGDSQQAIYGWRGAVDSLARFKQQGEAYATLTQSFRFGPEIAHVANLLLGKCQAELRLVGAAAHSSTVGSLDDADTDAVLCRSNARAVMVLLDMQRQGRKAHLLGGGGEVLSFAKAAKTLMSGGYAAHPDLICFSSWAEVQAYVEYDPQGDELRLLVKLIDDFGVDTIVTALSNMPPEAGAVTISTAHKAKGREWNRVRLESDFIDPGERDGDMREEWRLLYVAATRARQQLDVTLCEPIRKLLVPQLPLVAS